MYERDYSYKYKIDLQSDKKYYLKIYYKNMQIYWTLQEYTQFNIESVSQEILKKTKNTKYYGLLKMFVCKSKKDLNIIYKCLYSAYFESKTFPNIYIIEQSLKNLASNNDKWQFYD